MLILDKTTATGESDVFSPTDDAVYQLEADSDNLGVDLLARVHEDAPWMTVASLHSTKNPIMRVAWMPYMKASYGNNGELGRVRLWNSEA